MAVDTNPPKSSHLADPSLAPFLAPTFDAATYFNTTLPALSLSARRPSQPTPSTSLAELSTHTQTLLSQLTAQTTRLSTVLTQLTDDILRSGARLAYQVELLRGETLGLSEALTGTLSSDVEKFVPGGLTAPASTKQEITDEHHELAASPPPQDVDTANTSPAPSNDPQYVTSLRTLTHVRTRLETVIQTFGDAMQWTMPPSSISASSSLISVSAPEPGSSTASTEEKGRMFAEKLRTEIGDLVVLGESGRGEGGYEAALLRIQGLRDLASVWKGTAEEKARGKFVDSLVKVAEERARSLEGGRGVQAQGQRRRQSSAAGRQGVQGGGGFLDGLQRMRGNF